MYNFKNFKVETLKNGNIQNIFYKDVKINLLTISELDNPIINVYVRNNDQVVGLLNTNIEKQCLIHENGIKYVGQHEDLEFGISFIFDEDFYQVQVDLNKESEVIYTQDIGLNGAGNSLYASQYIDNRVYKNENGYNICMRRTQKTHTGYPFIQLGSNKEVVKYATEGFDFYSKEYRRTKEVTAINLASRERNYELAFAALEVEKTNNVTFYSHVLENKETPISSLVDASPFLIEKSLSDLVETKEFTTFNLSYINGLDVEHCDLIDPEYDEKGNLLAYYSNKHSHIVLPQKELIVDRHHANIITSKTWEKFSTNVLVTSNYMNGIFWAQNAISNTQLNSYNKNIASYLDFNKSEGLRIYIKENNQYAQLNMPSFYEVGFNYSKWVYVLENNKIEITVNTSIDNQNITLNINSEKEVEFLLVDSLNDNFKLNANLLETKENTLQFEKMPNVKYQYVTSANLSNTNKDFTLDNTIYITDNTNALRVEVQATINGEFKASTKSLSKEIEAYYNEFTNIIQNFNLTIEGVERENINSFNHLIYWYLHNGLIHFATPHGVEQHGGAAWGTRDVCQGPVELFSTFNQHHIVRQILIKLFDNQFIEDGNWPQWFMFDEYTNIRPNESHGDIIAWPIKALATYINNTNDLTILDEEVGFYHHDSMKRANETSTIFEHVKLEVNYIKDHFIEGTYLSQYGEGDWDDTLQPANSKLRKKMVSGWTVPLTYQGFSQFANLIKDYDVEYSQELDALANNIKADYRKYFIKDGVVAGFIYMNDLENIDYLLHPLDKKTGINYRLLPINESMIGDIFTKEEIANHINIIDKNLKCPDGVRLMNRPVNYDGGVEHIFQRGESASTIGREISLQYIHAHIRYIEAMAHIEQGARAYEGLKVVSPFIIRQTVKNSAYRQSNSYFSSSEGDIDNRYVYADEFDKLRTGDVAVRGGWRIYSSGPGIYLHQFINSYLGVKFVNEGILFDTKVGGELSGLTLNFTYDNQNIEVIIDENNSNILEKFKTRNLNGLLLRKEAITKDLKLTLKKRG